MATFLDDLSIYNAKAAAAITLASTTGDSGKANLMSSLKSTANDTSLTEEVRLNALTALINVGNLLDIPLPPYFPITTTFANTQTYTGLHNDLIGLDVEPYLHITTAEKSFYANKANLSDISFANLIDAYTANLGLNNAINAKQNALNGTGFVKASGGTITYDNSTYLTSISGIVAGGDLDGTYPNPTLRNTSVIGQLLTGFNGSASTGTITGADTILSAFETLNANVDSLAASSGTITSVSFALPSSVFSYTAGPFNSGAANLSGTFVNQNQNRFFAGPSSGGAGQPDFRAIVAGDFPASGATAGSYGSSSSIPVITVDTYGRVTNISSVASASGGQVNTITYSVPAGVFTSTVTGTTAVGITLGLGTQTANTVWAGPTSGVDATPGFRSLVALDIPNIAISQVTNLQNELDSKMTFLLNDGEIWIGNASNAPTNQSLTGDVTMDRDGVVTIEDEAVTFAKMQNITSGNILGRWDASTPGPIQQISLSADFDLDSGTGILSLAVPVAPILNSKGGLITYRQSIGQQVQLTAVFDGNLLITDTAEDDGLKWVTAQGDIEVDGALDGTFNITAGAVTLAKMATLAANSFIGNNTGSSATPIALTVTQATAMLNQFTTSAKGLVPASGGVGATYYLNATGGWSVPAGGGGGGTVTSANQYSIPYYSVSPSGTTVIGLAPQTTNGVYFLRANVTASAAVAPDWLGSTGTGNVVLATSPTLVTPTLGAALATSINGLTITSSTGTLTIANGSTLATSGAFSTTLTATATTTLTLPTTGTLATLAGTETFTNKTLNGPKIGTAAGSGHFHMHFANSAPTGLADYITVFGDTSPTKKLGFLFELDTFESYFQFEATTSSKTYTFPDLSGTVALLANAAAFTSVTVGTASSLAGDVVFQNATNATTQTFRGTNPTSSIVYLLPTTAPTAGQALVSTAPSSGIATLSWSTVSGAGVNTMAAIGSTPNANGATISGTTLNLQPADATNGGVVSTAAQTFAGVKTFSSNIIFGGTAAAPTLTTRSGGTKLVLNSTISASALDYAWGVGTGTMWGTLGASTDQFILYAPISSVVTNVFSVSGTGSMTMRGGTITMSTSTIAGNVTGSADTGIFSRNFINLGNGGGTAIPATVGSSWATRSLGSRVIIQATSTTSQADMAIGYTTNSFWFSLFTATSGSTYDWYGAATKIMTLRGDGLLTLTGTLALRAGAAAAGSAPLAFTSGTNLSTPVNGSMEYNGTNLFFTRTGAVREGVLTQSAVTTEVLVSDTSVTINIGGTTYKLLAKA